MRNKTNYLSYFILLISCFGLVSCSTNSEGLNKINLTAKAKYKSKGKGMLEDFQLTSSGLQYKDLEVGDGNTAKSGDVVSVHYTGTFFESGDKFDSSKDRGTPFEFNLGTGQVIKGWDEGVQGMKIGGKRILVVPPNLAYGPGGIPGAIPPNSTLKFEVELLGLK